MKFRFKIFILLPLLLLLNRNIKAGNCIPYGTTVTLTRQSEVDSFPINYPGCNVVDGGLKISGNDINNLDALLGVKTIGYNLEITDNPVLNDLSGLDSLIHCRNTIRISNNRKLINLNGLNSLDTIGNFDINSNENILDFSGLQKIKYIGSLNVENNKSLINLHGMEGLVFLDNFTVRYNTSLINLVGFDSVTQLYQHCFVSDNPSLINLFGLHNLVKTYSSLNFYRNNALVNLNGLSSLRLVELGIVIQENANLINLEGLTNLDTINGSLVIQLNQSLQNLHGLEDLKYIGSSISIWGNPSLCSINEINPNLNIIPIGYTTDLVIAFNVNLSCCSIVDDLINSNNISVAFIDNAPGCNNITEVRTIGNNNNCCSTKYTFLKDTICQGESVVFDNKTLSTSGTYYDTIIVGSIDSIIVFQLTVRNKSYQIQNKNLCIGQSFTLSNGRIITTNGTYNDTIPNICDSIIEYRLSFLNNITTNQNASVCKGKTYTLPKGNTVSVAGIYKDTLQASFGCDSIIITNLTITNPTPFNNNVTICSGKTFTRPNGIMVSTTGIYYDTIKAPNTCDSVIITNLTVTPYLQSAQTISVCSGKSFVLPGGRSVNQSGIYKDTIRNNFSCDSIITTNLTVTNPIPFMNTAVICEGQAYTLPDGNSVTTAGTYTDTIKQTNTCDSVVITNLSVLPNNFIVSLNATDTIESGSAIQLQPVYNGGTALSWSWSPSNYLSCTTCEQTVATPLQTTQYIVKVKSTDGCEDTAQTKIVVRQTEIYIPQAFSPNNDGVNDKVVVFASNPAAFSIKIYNRWSELLFESDTINDTWNGTYKGDDCMQDTYTYILDVTMQNGKQYHKQGTILLLR